MPTVRLERRVAADPTGLALLLAGPAAYPLWPGVVAVETSPDGDEDGGVMLRLAIPDGRPAEEIPVRVTARRPQSPPSTRYVLRFTAASARRSVDGVLTLAYADPQPYDGRPNATSAVLEMTLPEADGDTVPPTTMRVMGEGFLARLARAGEERAQAA